MMPGSIRKRNLLWATLSAIFGNFGEAYRRLEACPHEHRGWEWGHLHLRTDYSSPQVLRHPSGLNDLAFDPSGRRVATAAKDANPPTKVAPP